MTNDIRDRQPERLVRMSIRLAQRPRNHFIQLFRVHVSLLGHLREDRVDGLALFVLLFALDEVFGGHAALGQVDVACGN
jgi:hypothetical protein